MGGLFDDAAEAGEVGVGRPVGAVGEDGGFVEVSGKKTLVFDGRVDARAPHGAAGTLLLDPEVLIIEGGATNSPPGGVGTDDDLVDNQILFAENHPGTTTITEGKLEALDADIILGATREIRTGSTAFADGKLCADIDQLDASFAEAARAGRYRYQSATFYLPDQKSNPKPGAYYLHHVAILGAEAPAVPGLAPVQFNDGGEGLAFTAPIPAASAHRVIMLFESLGRYWFKMLWPQCKARAR